MMLIYTHPCSHMHIIGMRTQQSYRNFVQIFSPFAKLAVSKAHPAYFTWMESSCAFVSQFNLLSLFLSLSYTFFLSLYITLSFLFFCFSSITSSYPRHRYLIFEKKNEIVNNVNERNI